MVRSPYEAFSRNALTQLITWANTTRVIQNCPEKMIHLTAQLADVAANNATEPFYQRAYSDFICR
ncbi:MAG: hypothetical protein ACFB0E_16245 [Leptolyngbyaceae cyanobacterium]